MKSLILKQDGLAAERPESVVLTDMTPFVDYTDHAEPEPDEGEVKIKVSLASVNPSDEMFIQGLYGQRRVQGTPAGFEGVGEVVASGGGPVADGIKGLRVAFVAVPGKPGSWGEYAIANAATCIPLIPEVRDEDGAAMIVNPLTALAMFDIVREAHDTDGAEKAFVITAGASQLCKLMIAVAKDEGFRPIAIVRRDSQIEMLKQAGATHVLNCESDGFAADMQAVMKAEKPRIFLDAVANGISSAIFTAMPRKARWIIYGKLDDEMPVLQEPGQMIFMMKQIEGFWLTRWMTEKPMADKMKAIQTAQKRFASGEWQTDVTAIIPLEDAIARVPEELAKPNGKVFIRP